MNIKQFGKNGLCWCASIALFGVLLLPLQAALYIPVQALKPVKSMDIGLPISLQSMKMGSNLGVPVPKLKPIGFGESQKDNAVVSFRNSKYLKLTNLLSSIMPSAGEELVIKSDAPLSAKQSKIYTKMFDLQRRGKWAQANEVLSSLKDNRLVGHVLYQRYMHPAYSSSFTELKDWLEAYSDHPNAKKIYKLASEKNGGNSSALKNPGKSRILAQIKEPNIYYPKRYSVKVSRSREQSREVRGFSNYIQKLVRKGRINDALAYLTTSKRSGKVAPYMDNVEVDRLKAKIAGGYLYRGMLVQAHALAQEAYDRSGKYAPEAAWVNGMTYWMKKDFAVSASYFEKTGSSPYASGWRASAGYYWAARSYSRTGDHSKIVETLEKSSSHSRTFYGLIATKMLNKPFQFNWENPAFSQDFEDMLKSEPAGQRAMLLVAADQHDLAEEELMRLNYDKNVGLRRAALAYSMHIGLPGVALRLGNMVPDSSNKYYDSAVYPDVPWEPRNGFSLDPSLIFAVMRQESRFDQQAKSYSGALGLMQVMPKTARYVASKHNYGHRMDKIALTDPETNMMVGQDYLTYLLKGRYVRGDMISLLVAYNAGPGNLMKWRKRFDDTNKVADAKGFSDPLLFIETLPIQETRDYVIRVMSNYWIYRLRAGEELTSLANLVKGKYPRYAAASSNGVVKPYKVVASR